MISRRTFLVGGAATAALAVGGLIGVEDGALPGRLRMARLIGRCDIDTTPPATPVGDLRTGRFFSQARNVEVGWALAVPPGATPHALPTAPALPVALVLHGRGVDHTAAFDQLRLDAFLADYVRGGGTPFAVAAVDGGNGYWHPRRSGDDPLAMLRDEFVPMLAGLGLRTRRLGVLGWSMGGYGALLLARESHRGHLGGIDVAACAAASPALFPSFRASASGAFDDADDFTRYGALADDPDVGATPLFVSCGSDDGFTGETRRYRSHVTPSPAGGITRGCHTDGYWRFVAGPALAFLGAHL